MQRRLQAARGPGARRISDQTVRNRLHTDGLKSRTAAVKPGLTPRHMRLRLEWGLEKRQWTRQAWNSCLFCDESRFCLVQDDKSRRVWRRRFERRHHADFVNRREAFGGGGVMVWGAIAHNYKSDLVFIDGNLTARRYLDTIIIPHIRPYAGALGPDNFVLVDDNALPHRGGIVNCFLENEGIERMDWPPKSPDFNPIEHIWGIMKRKLSRRLLPQHSLQDLRRFMVEEWQELPMNTINNCVRSMPRRARQSVEQRGSHIDY